ncbi:glucosaminidase domain-containing protein [Bacillus sp. EB600]|uniref:glucosaminidase domain-containing protein n=1 Tax=Bacillus sp. EB600 TaxID=2806345 RepID=UPI00210E93FE|nr:glucosaminidase domain-containing protein [Bacillus sp. EB600]MCQ6280570.1 glucosaminidase domain-containing protein [Bacillus sp. EB600]
MDKKIYLLSSCILTLLTVPLTTSAETVQSNQQLQTQQQIETDLSGVTQQKLQVQEEIEATTKKLAELDQQIAESTANIQKKEGDLAEIQRRMDSLNKEDKRITTLLTNREREFKDRVSSYYRTKGQMSFLNVIFSVNSFGEFIDHFVSYDKIVNGDQQFIETYIADQNKVTGIKENVKALQNSTIQEKAELEAIKASQENDRKEKETLSTFLEEKKKQLEKEEQEKKLALELLQNNGTEILALINNNGSDHTANVQLINSIIAPFIADAQKLQQEKGVPASITLGQIILESSGSYNGLSGLAFQAKNLFGIKGTGSAGSVNWDTTEFVNGQSIVTTAQFASYSTYYDSMVDHANLLLTPRYQKYLKNAASIIDYAHGIHDAGYATDPNYANKLLKIIYQYDLLKLDV